MQLSEHRARDGNPKGSPYGCLPSRVQVCNLNLEVYVFLGDVTVQLGIVCSNYKVQVANLNPPEVLFCRAK